MVYEHFDGDRARGAAGASCRTSPTRPRTCCATHGVERGDRVAVVLPPTPETAAIFFGTWKLGAILLSMSVLYGDDGHPPPARRLDAEGARHRRAPTRARFDAPGRRGARPRRRRCSPARRPTSIDDRHRRRRPGAALLHVGHDRAGEGHRPRPPLPARPRGVRLLPRRAGRRALPRHGRVGLGRRHRAAARARGASARCSASSSARAASTPHKQLDFLSPPRGHERLHDADRDALDDGDRRRRRRATRSSSASSARAGEPLNPEAIRWFREQYGLTVLDYYGLTESYPLCANFPFMEVREGSMGRPMPGWDVQILDEDEQPGRAGRARRDLPARALEPALPARLLEQPGGRARRPSAASGSTPRTPRRRTRTATSGTRAAPTT